MRHHRFGAIATGFFLAACCAAPVVAQSTPPHQYIIEHTTTPESVSSREGSIGSVLAELTKSGKKRPKIGLALGGGGTRGAAHIGVLRVFEKEGIPIDCVAGTSIGAIVGGLYCSGVSLDELESIVQHKSMMKAYNTVPIWLRVALTPIFALPHLVHCSHYDGLYRGKKFAKYIDKCVGEKHRCIESTKIPFRAVVTSLIDGKAHTLYKGDLAQAIQASSAIPVLRRPVEIDGNLYVDGGIVKNLPVDDVRDMGADIVIAVNIDETFDGTKLERFKKIGSVGNRVINIILCRVDEDELNKADVVIQPAVNDIKLLSTNKADAIRCIRAGETAAAKQVETIRKSILSRAAELNTPASSQSASEACETP